MQSSFNSQSRSNNSGSSYGSAEEQLVQDDADEILLPESATIQQATSSTTPYPAFQSRHY